MLAFSEWIAGSRASAFVQDVLWLIPTVQTVHILALALLFSAVGAVTLRSFGRLARTAPRPRSPAASPPGSGGRWSSSSSPARS